MYQCEVCTQTNPSSSGFQGNRVTPAPAPRPGSAQAQTHLWGSCSRTSKPRYLSFTKKCISNNFLLVS